MYFKKTVQFKTVKVNIKETTTKRASDSQQHQMMPRYQSRRIYDPPRVNSFKLTANRILPPMIQDHIRNVWQCSICSILLLMNNSNTNGAICYSSKEHTVGWFIKGNVRSIDLLSMYCTLTLHTTLNDIHLFGVENNSEIVQIVINH